MKHVFFIMAVLAGIWITDFVSGIEIRIYLTKAFFTVLGYIACLIVNRLFVRSKP